VSRLATRFAPRLYINTFGGITVHKGSWAGPPIPVTKKRTLSLLGLLVARGGDSVSRDQILDALWPEADPSAAVNSLNQTLFQLRRSLEPHYRDGRSPQYITSSADGVELNPQLVRLDWVELLRRSKAAPKDPNTQGRLVDLVEESITGQFLSEMLYDDWSMGPRQRVHDGLRAALLPLALDPVLPPAQRLKVARALANLDPFDESAQIALTLSLAEDGQRIAARAHLETFIARLAAEFEEPPSPALVSALAELRVKS
jgi:DNA-binding SARP family transcriptional activator